MASSSYGFSKVTSLSLSAFRIPHHLLLLSILAFVFNIIRKCLNSHKFDISIRPCRCYPRHQQIVDIGYTFIDECVVVCLTSVSFGEIWQIGENPHSAIRGANYPGLHNHSVEHPCNSDWEKEINTFSWFNTIYCFSWKEEARKEEEMKEEEKQEEVLSTQDVLITQHPLQHN